MSSKEALSPNRLAYRGVSTGPSLGLQFATSQAWSGVCMADTLVPFTATVMNSNMAYDRSKNSKAGLDDTKFPTSHLAVPNKSIPQTLYPDGVLPARQS